MMFFAVHSATSPPWPALFDWAVGPGRAGSWHDARALPLEPHSPAVLALLLAVYFLSLLSASFNEFVPVS